MELIDSALLLDAEGDSVMIRLNHESERCVFYISITRKLSLLQICVYSRKKRGTKIESGILR